MKKITNECHIEGWLYDHALEMRVSGENAKNPGVQFIRGSIDVATDNALTNIVTVHYTYVVATTKKGTANATYGVLADIYNGKTGTVMSVGKDNAAKVRIDTSIGVNDFYSNRTGTEELVSAKRNEGGFIHIVNQISEDETTRNTFKVDMIINNVRRIEADPERNLPEKVEVKGCTFGYGGTLLPVSFIAYNAGAMDYYEGLEASPKNPIFTKLWGRQVSQTVVRTITEESAFGDASVREVRSSRKEWVITGGAKEPYAFDDEETITEAELNKAIKDRELMLAGLKARTDEYRSTSATPAAAATAPANSSEFKF